MVGRKSQRPGKRSKPELRPAGRAACGVHPTRSAPTRSPQGVTPKYATTGAGSCQTVTVGDNRDSREYGNKFARPGQGSNGREAGRARETTGGGQVEGVR